MGSAVRIPNYASLGVAQLISMYSKARGAIVSLLPVILGVTPNTGPLTGLTLVRITGYNFEGVSSVTIGGAACTGLIVGGSIITCYSPAGTPGAQNVVVTGPAGATTLAGGFTYATAALAPTISSVSTNGGAVGDIDGGYTATVTGTNFVIGATTFTFGGTSATGVSVSNSTTATMTVPAHATGAVSVVATTAGGSNGANAAFRYYSPAEKNLGLWVRGSFAGDPGASTASAGASSGRSLIDGVTPAVGATLNGFAPASYNGTTKFQTSATQLNGLVTSSAGTFFCLYKATTAAAASGNVYADAGLLTMVIRGDLALSINSTGVRGGGFDASVNPIDVTKAASTNAWHLAHMRWSSTLLEVGVDGVWQTGAALAGGGMLSTNYSGTNIQIGCDWTAVVFLNGFIEEWAASPTRFSDQDILDVKSYIDTRYNQTL